jgi:Ca2+-binding EF-hand superfamily protein
MSYPMQASLNDFKLGDGFLRAEDYTPSSKPLGKAAFIAGWVAKYPDAPDAGKTFDFFAGGETALTQEVYDVLAAAGPDTPVSAALLSCIFKKLGKDAPKPADLGRIPEEIFSAAAVEAAFSSDRSYTEEEVKHRLAGIATFRSLDSDGDRCITLEEFGDGMANIGFLFPLMSRATTPGGVKCSTFDDYILMLDVARDMAEHRDTPALRDFAGRLFDYYDEDKDGALSTEEIMKTPFLMSDPSPEKIKKAFSRPSYTKQQFIDLVVPLNTVCPAVYGDEDHAMKFLKYVLMVGIPVIAVIALICLVKIFHKKKGPAPFTSSSTPLSSYSSSSGGSTPSLLS